MYNYSDKRLLQYILFVGAIQAGFFGVVLIFREFYYTWDWINLKIPSPSLYADVSAVFLLVMSFWTFYIAKKMQPEFWIIIAGSSAGRIIYFNIALVGFLTSSNEFMYVLIGLSDLLIGISLIYVAYRLKKAKN